MATIAQVDAELLRTHEQFLRADRRGDVADATDLLHKLGALYDVRALIPQQHLPAHDD